MMSHELRPTIQAPGTREVSFPVQRLICAGQVGRGRASLYDQIAEPARLGMASPPRTTTARVLPQSL